MIASYACPVMLLPALPVLLFLNLAMPWALKPHCLKPCFSFVGCWRRLIWTLWLSGTAFAGYKQTKCTEHRLAASHEPVCFVHAKMTPNACALLEFTTAPLPILRVSSVVDIGITTTTSPALDIAALCLDSWPAAIFCSISNFRLLPALTCQLTADLL